MCDQHISFRAGRPCIDRILALRIIVQKLLELQLNLILCFLDFEEKCLVLSAVSPDRKFRILNHACQRSQRMARLENGGCRKGVCLLPIPILHRNGWLMWVSVANHSIQKVQNLGNKRRQIYRKPRQESGLCDISYARSLEKYSPKFIDRHVGVPLRGTNMAAGKNKNICL